MWGADGHGGPQRRMLQEHGAQLVSWEQGAAPVGGASDAPTTGLHPTRGPREPGSGLLCVKSIRPISGKIRQKTLEMF